MNSSTSRDWFGCQDGTANKYNNELQLNRESFEIIFILIITRLFSDRTKSFKSNYRRFMAHTRLSHCHHVIFGVQTGSNANRAND